MCVNDHRYKIFDRRCGFAIGGYLYVAVVSCIFLGGVPAKMRFGAF
jgi:hypothetical protein